MIGHYLELAWQQLEKYRLQSVVSIVSLGIGFACFALAAMWIKYETTFDAFHEDAENIYTVMEDKQDWLQIVKREQLEQMPEIAVFTQSSTIERDTINGKIVKATERMLRDEHWFDVFSVKFIEGNDGFMNDEGQVVISDRLARELWGSESPIGKELHLNSKVVQQQRRIVTGVFKDWGTRTNYPTDLLSKFPEGERFSRYGTVRLHPWVNVDSLNMKLKKLENPLGILIANVVPVTEYRQATLRYEQENKMNVNHVELFAIASLLLIVCGLLNYLTMFINRLFIRKREIALRTVLGATGGDILLQFLIEYGLLLVIALFFGLFTIEIVKPHFLTLSGLPEDAGYIYGEIFVYFTCIVAVSLFVSLPVISYFRRRSLHNSIVGANGMARYNSFRRISTGCQMGIAVFCIFCVTVVVKQLYDLRIDSTGFKRENRGYVPLSIYAFNYDFGRQADCVESVLEFLRQQPEIDTVFNTAFALNRANVIMPNVLKVEDNPSLSEDFKFMTQGVTHESYSFFEPTLSCGRWFYPGESDSVIVNEAFVKAMGWKNPIGQDIYNGKDKATVIGVFKDTRKTPNEISHPFLYGLHEDENTRDYSSAGIILFKFKPGTWKTVQRKIMAHYEKNGWDAPAPISMEEEHLKSLKSENNLQLLLSITTGVCILIALFGVWSMIMLTCEQRRKEIAVRKVFGATTKDILDMFFSEYMLLQGLAALVAFPLGYIFMKPWLENYMTQTDISWWIFVGIFMAVTLLVALCIGWRVWKTAKARPADEICKG